MAARISKSTALRLASQRPGQTRTAPVGSHGKAANKYGAVKTRFGDEVFDSRRECERWVELRRLQSAGLISELERQVSYDLTVNGVRVAKIRPDFRYRRGAELVVEDVKAKPTMTPVFRLKAKLLKAIHGVTLEIVQ